MRTDQMITDQVFPKPGHREFIDGFSDAVLLIDHKSQRIIDVNCRAHQLMGISTDDGGCEGSAAEVIATSPIGLIEGLESLLTRGEGRIDVPAGETNGPFVARAQPFVDGGSSGTMLIIEKGAVPSEPSRSWTISGGNGAPFWKRSPTRSSAWTVPGPSSPPTGRSAVWDTAWKTWSGQAYRLSQRPFIRKSTRNCWKRSSAEKNRNRTAPWKCSQRTAGSIICG